MLYLILLAYLALTNSFAIEPDLHVEVRDLNSEKVLHPDQLNLEVEDTKGTSSVRVVRNTNIDFEAPVFTADENGKIVLDKENPSLGDHAAYRNTSTGNYITVRSIIQNDGTYKREMSGSLFLDGQEYLISPYSETKKRSTNVAGDNVHTLVKKQITEKFHDDDGVEHSVAKVRRSFDEKVYPLLSKRASRKQNFGVKLLVVLDYATYNYWKQRESNVDAMLRKYFSHIVHGMDMRYDSIDASDFSIYVRLAGFFIAKRSKDSRFTEAYKQRGRDRYQVDANRALEKIRDWDNQNEDSLLGEINHDHAMVFTSMDIYSGGKLGTAGLAYTKSMCRSISQSIVEDHGGFNSVGTAAHELGHSLGAADHDGTRNARRNACHPDMQFIMTAVGGNVHEKYAENPFRFSPCSVQQFRDYLVRGGNGKCLLRRATHADQKSFLEHTKSEPGQMYGPDDQCKQIWGEDSYYCGGDEMDKAICRTLWCYDKQQGNCIGRGGAIRGTTCGDRKWCQRGRCRSSSKAPKADPNCVHGGYKLPVMNGRTCSQAVPRNPRLCTNDYNRKLCCGACNELDKKKNKSNNSGSIGSSTGNSSNRGSSMGNSSNRGSSTGNSSNRGSSTGNSSNRGSSTGRGQGGNHWNNGNRFGSTDLEDLFGSTFGDRFGSSWGDNGSSNGKWVVSTDKNGNTVWTRKTSWSGSNWA